MKKVLYLALVFSLFASLALAQTQPKRTAQTITKTPSTPVAKTTAPAASAASAVNDELLALLPASDVLAVVDINRLFNQLMPALADLKTGGLDKLGKELAEFAQKTGIDPAKVNRAVAGFSMKGSQATGAIIVSGVDVTNPQVEAALKEFKTEFKTSDYRGKTIFNLLSKVKAPEAGPLSVKTDETALAALGGQRFVFGDLSAVKNVIDISSGSAKGGVTPEMASALNETKASALLRFALNIPDSLKAEAADQGDLFKSVSTIKMVLGNLDMATDFSLSLDALMRTTSAKDATELEDGLKGLVGLIRGIFGGGGSGDAKTDAIGLLLDQIKIGSKQNDVSLSISLPRATLDQLLKKPAPPAEKKP